jgi:hypothetical protein
MGLPPKCLLNSALLRTFSDTNFKRMKFTWGTISVFIALFSHELACMEIENKFSDTTGSEQSLFSPNENQRKAPVREFSCHSGEELFAGVNTLPKTLKMSSVSTQEEKNLTSGPPTAKEENQPVGYLFRKSKRKERPESDEQVAKKYEATLAMMEGKLKAAEAQATKNILTRGQTKRATGVSEGEKPVTEMSVDESKDYSMVLTRNPQKETKQLRSILRPSGTERPRSESNIAGESVRFSDNKEYPVERIQYTPGFHQPSSKKF